MTRRKRRTDAQSAICAEEVWLASSDEFDLVVIGCGPAGEKAGAQAAYFGKRVAVIECGRACGRKLHQHRYGPEQDAA